MKKLLISSLCSLCLCGYSQSFEIRQQVTSQTNIVITTPELTEAQVDTFIDGLIASGYTATYHLDAKQISSFSITEYERPVKVFITNTVPDVVIITDSPAVVDENGVETTPAITHQETNMVERVDLTYQTLRTFKTDLKLK